MTSVGSRNTDTRAGWKTPERPFEFSRAGSRQQMTSVGSRRTDTRAVSQVRKVPVRSSELAGSRRQMTSVYSAGPLGMKPPPQECLIITSDGSRSTDGVSYSCPNCGHYGYKKRGSLCSCGSKLFFSKYT